MKHHIAFKALAIFLATLCLFTAIISTGGIAALIATDLYENTVEEAHSARMETERQSFAIDLVYAYATLHLGHIPREYFAQYYGFDWQTSYFREGYYFYSIYDENGMLVFSTVEQELADAFFYEIELTNIIYRRIITDPEDADPDKSIFTDNYFDAESERYVEISYQATPLGDYTVQLYLLPDAYSYDTSWLLLQQLYAIRQQLFWILGAAILGFLLSLIYLCCAAGRKPGSDEIRPGGLNRIPLDLGTAIGGAGIFLLVNLAIFLLESLNADMPQLIIFLLLLVTVLVSLTAVGMIFSWAAQLKTPGRFWLKNTIIGRIFHFIFHVMARLMRMLPVMWQWVMTAMFMGVTPFVLFLLYLHNRDSNTLAEIFFLLLFLLAILADVVIALYGSYCFGILMKGAQRMSKGNLQGKVPLKYLVGCFQDFALCLNTLSDAASISAEKQMRSERMKTELITNVSHDIKTPLTSIINFVDLLQKPHTEEQEQEYLEVLSRQSNQMKKLIEDLMELSKANSGNIAVNLETVDAVEAMNQALGEFSDRLDDVGLTPVFHHPEHPVCIRADGHHVWRVLFNLLTNAIKYALPGTRLYVDLMQMGDQVLLSMKNISRQELNISADELMERFVQGDASRRSEGSGLGLNIAKSLMEVQNGQLELLLDGDLFKVTLIFPAAEG